jgi:hypothetical protein
MALTYEPIATTTLSSSSTTITLSSIPSTYTDLRVVIFGLCTVDGDAVRMRFNGDSSAVYSWIALSGNGTGGSTTFSNNETFSRTNAGGNNLNTRPSLITTDIFSYSGSNFKTMIHTSNADQSGSGTVSRSVSLWRSTSAINSIALSLVFSASYATGTTVTIYGIKAA